LIRSRWPAGHIRAVDGLEAQAAAAAAVRGVAHEQVGVNQQARSNAIAQPGNAIVVGHAADSTVSPLTTVWPSGAAPMTISPPPLVGMVGLVL